MTKIYQQAFSEVNEILSYLSKENYNKIPKEVIDAIEENKDNDYVFFIDTTIPFEEQELLEESKAILFNIYKDYLSNDEIKDKIIELQKEEQIVKESINSLNIHLNDLFPKKPEKEIEVEVKTETALIQIDNNKNIFIKILEKIKNIFKKRK